MNAFFYIYYGGELKSYVERFAFYYNNQSFNDLKNIVLEHMNYKKNPENKKFIIGTHKIINLKNIHKSRIKEYAEYNPKHNINETYYFENEPSITIKFNDLIELKTKNNENIKYVFSATLVCSKCGKKNILFINNNLCLECNIFNNNKVSKLKII